MVNGKCEQIRQKMNNIRRARHFENKNNLRNRADLKNNEEEVDETNFLIKHFKSSTSKTKIVKPQSAV